MVPARPARTHSANRAASRASSAWGKSATTPATAKPASSARARTCCRDSVLVPQRLDKELDMEPEAPPFAY